MSGSHAWASRPPMGWTSRGCLSAHLTEAYVKTQADYMATALARFGWQYVVVDLQRHVPHATVVADGQEPPAALDGHGRSLPAPERFPSCAGGFQPLADYVHALGLRFGLRLQRGIPRAAVDGGLPILGTQLTARDVVSSHDDPSAHPDMQGLDLSRPGAQAYYDSVFAALAAWGVDYVEVDDIGAGYAAHETEVECIRRAIERAGRPMMLGLSPGPVPLSAAQHVVRHANLWCIGDEPGGAGDEPRERSARLCDWSPQRGPGHWPDAGTLPLGAPDLGRGALVRATRESLDERRALLTLSAVARSPLLLGGDLTRMDGATLSLLTNREVIGLDQNGRDSRALFDDDGLIAWVSSSGLERYLALFNTRERRALTDEQVLARVSLKGGRHAFQTSFLDVPVCPGMLVHLVADDGRGGSGEQHAIVWGEPVLLGAAGELSVLDLPWSRASSRRGGARVQRDASDGPRAGAAGGPRPASTHVEVLVLGGRPLDRGVLVYTKSAIAFQVPPGYDRLVVECGFEGAALPGAEGEIARCIVYGETPEAQEKRGEREGETVAGAGSAALSSAAAGLPISVPLADLGIDGGERGARVHDVWAEADLGACEAVFTRTIPWHGAGLFRISPPAR